MDNKRIQLLRKAFFYNQNSKEETFFICKTQDENLPVVTVRFYKIYFLILLKKIFFYKNYTAITLRLTLGFHVSVIIFGNF